MSGCIALVVGAGRGRRFGSDLPKQYCKISGIPVISRTLQVFVNHPSIAAVRTVIHPDDRDLYDDAASSFPANKLLEPVGGGKSRQESVLLGLESLVDLKPNSVLIHDAARPFVSNEIINRVIKALDNSAGVIAALPVHDTLKSSQDGYINDTVDRSELWRAQTPQGFRFADILQAHRRCQENNNGSELTDDAAVAQEAGLPVELVTGSEENIKITTTDDLMQAERYQGGYDHRTGQGFDVHRFCEGDSLTLCGVKIPYSFSLEGHSDADVAMHALTDALMGAVAQEDIGSHFPPSESQWKGASSEVFLVKARKLIEELGGVIVNVDVTIICEEPKIGPFRDAMRENVANLLDINENRVSVKATTTERLGFTGRKEGIAAQAIATVKTP